MKIRSKITKKTVCRKCKNTFVSNDYSKCPVCSKKNRELAAKREENKQKTMAKNIEAMNISNIEENAEG